MLKNKKILISHFIILILGFSLGRFTAPQEKVKTIQVSPKVIEEKSSTPSIIELNGSKGSDPVTKIKKQFKYFKDSKGLDDIQKLEKEIQVADHDPNNGPNYRLIELYEDLLEKDAGNIEALAGYSNYLIMLNRMEEAIPLLESCVEVDKKNELCLGNLTIYKLNEGDDNKILNAINHCLKQTPQNMMCLNNKGQFLLRKNKLKSALSVFKAMEKYLENGIEFERSVLFLSLGYVYEGLKQNKKALKYFQFSCSEGMIDACDKADGSN